jgi:putative hydrolase of the HAD superfamily
MKDSIGAVILDLGNVLAFHDNAFFYRKFAERAGRKYEESRPLVPKSLWEKIQIGLLDREGIQKEVCELLGMPLSAAEFFELWNCHFTINESILPIVESLVGRVKLLLLSNTNHLHMDYLRPRLPILEKFDHLVLSQELGVAKPNPKIFIRAVELAGLQAHRTAYFDDIPEFVEAARAVGIQARLFTTTEVFIHQLQELGIRLPLRLEW